MSRLSRCSTKVLPECERRASVLGGKRPLAVASSRRFRRGHYGPAERRVSRRDIVLYVGRDPQCFANLEIPKSVFVQAPVPVSRPRDQGTQPHQVIIIQCGRAIELGEFEPRLPFVEAMHLIVGELIVDDAKCL